MATSTPLLHRGPEQTAGLGVDLSLELIGSYQVKPSIRHGIILPKGLDADESKPQKIIDITQENEDFFFRDMQRSGMYRMATQGSALIVSLIEMTIKANKQLPETSTLRGLSFMDKEGTCYPYARPLDIELASAQEKRGMTHKKHEVTMLTGCPIAQEIQEEIFAIDEIAIVAASKYVLR